MKPAITPSDITPQNKSSVGSIARMSRPIIRKLMTGAMPAIMKFMLMNSGTKLFWTFSKYVPPIMDFMNSDWKMKSPKCKTGKIFDDEIYPHRQPERGSDRRRQDDAGRIPATQ